MQKYIFFLICDNKNTKSFLHLRLFYLKIAAKSRNIRKFAHYE